MSGKATTLPPTLPPNIYSQASGGVATHATGTSGSFSPTQSAFPSSIQPQYTGSIRPLQPNTTGGQSSFSQRPAPPVPSLPVRPNASQLGSGAFGNASLNAKWDITPTEKASSDRFFETLDPQGRGYIEGEVAVPFMLESKLSGEDLAQIWDLTDILGDGKLTRDCFAVAMHLIQKRLAGNPIPAALPATMVPPSMRTTATSGPSPFSPPAHVQHHPPPPQHDLLGFDESPPHSATGSFPPIMQPQQTGSQASTAIPSATGPSPFTVPLQQTGSRASPAPVSSPFGIPMQPTGSQAALPFSLSANKLPTQDPFGASPFTSTSKCIISLDI
jgi:epidermal growth factor receptor substrate 15